MPHRTRPGDEPDRERRPACELPGLGAAGGRDMAENRQERKADGVGWGRRQGMTTAMRAASVEADFHAENSGEPLRAAEEF